MHDQKSEEIARNGLAFKDYITITIWLWSSGTVHRPSSFLHFSESRACFRWRPTLVALPSGLSPTSAWTWANFRFKSIVLLVLLLAKNKVDLLDFNIFKFPKSLDGNVVFPSRQTEDWNICKDHVLPFVLIVC